MTNSTSRGVGDARDRPRLSVVSWGARFAAAGLVVAVVLTVVTGMLARRVGTEEATRSFERLAAVVAGSVLAPALVPDVRQGDPGGQGQVARAVEPLVRADRIARITVLSADGRVVWSDQPGTIGTQHPLEATQKQALAQGSVVPDAADGAGDGSGNLLTMSVGLKDTAGVPLLADVSESSAAVDADVRTAWQEFTPAALGALLVLELVQVPFFWYLARAIRRHQDAEAALLEVAAEASGAERRRLAREVHDTIVPSLTGLTYELDAARLAGPGAAEPAKLLTRTAEGVRRSIADLRALSVDLSRARLPDTGLGAALADLTARMADSGIRLTIEATRLEELPRPTAEILYRCAQETLRNAAAHSRAELVELSVVAGAEEVTMTVDDDGLGFDEARLTASEDAGHLGLRALGDLVADAGGSLIAASAPGQGTRVVVRVPVNAAEVAVRGAR